MNEPEIKNPAPEYGMYISDRCGICGEYGEKAKPKICTDCWRVIKQIVAKYRDELLPDQAQKP